MQKNALQDNENGRGNGKRRGGKWQVFHIPGQGQCSVASQDIGEAVSLFYKYVAFYSINLLIVLRK